MRSTEYWSASPSSPASWLGCATAARAQANGRVSEQPPAPDLHHAGPDTPARDQRHGSPEEVVGGQLDPGIARNKDVPESIRARADQMAVSLGQEPAQQLGENRTGRIS